MKRLTLGLAVLLSGYAANSFAALPNGGSRCDVCVPSYCGGFTFGLTGLYWRPTTDHLDYALTFPAVTVPEGSLTDDIIFSNGRFHRLDHNYDWGFKANIGYVFPCSGNDVNLTYTHWDDSEHNRTDSFAAGFPTTSAPFFALGGFPIDFPATTITFTTAVAGIIPALSVPLALPAFTFLLLPEDIAAISARSRFENHTWDLDFGQAISVGCNFRLRWFGGLRYTRLKHNLDVTTEFDPTTGVFSTFDIITATGTPVTGTGIAVALSVSPVLDVTATLRDIARQKSDFDGIGPRFGFDASYHVGGGFGVVGSLSTSLLVGETESSFSERLEVTATAVLDTVGTTALTVAAAPLTISAVTSVDPALLALEPVATISFRHPDETRVVPNIDAKLGLDWTYQFCNCSRSKVTIEAGYMVSHYFNAIDRLSAIDAIAPEIRSRQALDVSFDGPYIGVQVNL